MVDYPTRIITNRCIATVRTVIFMITYIQQLLDGVVSILRIPIDFGPFSVSIFDIIIGQLLTVLVAYVVWKIFD